MEIGEVYYTRRICFCCGFVNAREVCVCTERGLRSDPTDMSSTRACSVCGKCSVHCPHNHTAGPSSGWETPAIMLGGGA